MINNSIMVAFRNLGRHKGNSFINTAGFAVGIACCILLGLYVGFEISFGRYNENAGRIFRLGVRAQTGGEQVEWGDSNAVAALADPVESLRYE